ncbi:MAG: GNAT family N-acetyltransferase [Actinocatenispora sp.]
MTVEGPELTLRPISGRDELDLFCRLPYTFNGELADDLHAGRRRPEWMWVALRGDHLVARLAWWTRSAGAAPMLLDIFDLDDDSADPDRLDVGVRLLETARAAVVATDAPTPEYDRFIPSDWREDTRTHRIVSERMTALERVGATLLVERLRLEWRPGTPVPPPTGRLEFRPADRREELIDLMARVLDGTLDAHSRDDLTRMTPGEAAAFQYEDELMAYTSPRDWWQVATLPGGGPVGFVIPARNDYNAIIAYIGVLPEHRGHGYVDDILAEGTRLLAGRDVPRIRASTDLGNVPMAKAFDRAGYVNFERSISMVWR